VLAALQRSAGGGAPNENDTGQIVRRPGETGGLVGAAARVCKQIVRARAPPVQKLTLLLRLASGEAAPVGPASDKARGEVMRLLRSPDAREALMGSPEAAGKLRPMLQAAGLAA